MNRREAIAALVALPAATRISVADLKPNDVLVVECDEHLHPEQAARIKATMELVWPGRKCAVFPKGLHLKIASEK